MTGQSIFLHTLINEAKESIADANIVKYGLEKAVQIARWSEILTWDNAIKAMGGTFNPTGEELILNCFLRLAIFSFSTLLLVLTPSTWPESNLQIRVFIPDSYEKHPEHFLP